MKKKIESYQGAAGGWGAVKSVANAVRKQMDIRQDVIAMFDMNKPWIPRDHSSAITEEEYIGSMALITGHQATSGNPCEGKLTDQFGQIHYLLLEPEEGKIFTKGDKVLII
ncbi:OB-fold-containig protein, partial [Escherichia coli]|uniref:OB-fold-containig protein n=1 Tax=Escherichia coli TaxID=562 RepID=UPI001FCEB278